jgi:hypothetical protein
LVAEKERRKLELLKQEEETWRQKNRALWLAAGDRNTKFFHSFSNYRRQHNAIWDIRKEGGSVATSQKELEEEVVVFFRNNYKAQENLSIVHQLEVIQAYPRIFSLEEGKRIVDHVQLSEVLATLKGFSTSKSLGSDGWTVEFFLDSLIYWALNCWKWWRNQD